MIGFALIEIILLWISIVIMIVLFFGSFMIFSVGNGNEASAEEYSIKNPMGKKPAAWSGEMVDGKPFKKDPPWVIGVSNYSLANSWRQTLKTSWRRVLMVF